jgi:hypothetical protein
MNVHFIKYLSKWDEWVEYNSHRIGGRIGHDVFSSDSEDKSD